MVYQIIIYVNSLNTSLQVTHVTHILYYTLYVFIVFIPRGFVLRTFN